MAAEFMRALEIKPDFDLNLQAVNEELLEFEQALENLLKEAVDVLYTAYVLEHCRPKQGQIDVETMAKLKYVVDFSDRVFGKARFDEAFARVHASNMSKVGPNGEIARKPNGCVAKGPHYVPAVLHDLVT
jgi:predicted HAD superfamily Cof-like phosphohydrolase